MPRHREENRSSHLFERHSGAMQSIEPGIQQTMDLFQLTRFQVWPPQNMPPKAQP
jgi:hypothetical protein